MGVINPEAADKPMDASTRSMRHSSAIAMRLWKMWREAESRVSSPCPLLVKLVLTSSVQADHLETMMRDQLKVQELMDSHLDSRDEELHQLCSQSQEDGTQIAALSLQLQELISSVEEQSKVVERDLEEVNGHFYCHRGEINRIKEREKKARGLIVGAAHKAELFKTRLNRMEDNVCKCGRTPSEVGEEFVSSEEEARTELSYASARGSKYVAPPMENPIPIPIPAPCCPGSTTVLPPLEEVTEEPTGAICDDLDTLLREADEGRVRDLQEGSSQSVVCSPPRLCSERWRRLNGIHQMHPGPGRREQRATHSCPYIRRDSSRHPPELWGPGEPGRHSASPPSSSLGAINFSLLWEAQGVPPSSSGRSGLVLQGEELVWTPGGELGLWIYDSPENWLD